MWNGSLHREMKLHIACHLRFAGDEHILSIPPQSSLSSFLFCFLSISDIRFSLNGSCQLTNHVTGKTYDISDPHIDALAVSSQLVQVTAAPLRSPSSLYFLTIVWYCSTLSFLFLSLLPSSLSSLSWPRATQPPTWRCRAEMCCIIQLVCVHVFA